MEETFVKQLYLKKVKETQEGMNEERWVHIIIIFWVWSVLFIVLMFLRLIVSWGQRADAEFSKKDILEYVAKVSIFNLAPYFIWLISLFNLKIMNKPIITFKKQYIDLNEQMANTSDLANEQSEN